MTRLLALVAAGCAGPEKGGPPDDAATHTGTVDTHTGAPDTESTTAAHSGHTGDPVHHTAAPIPVFDTAGPACAGTPPTDTGLIVETQVVDVDCDVALPPPSTPRAIVAADQVMRARVAGLEELQSCGISILGLGDHDGDGDGEFAVGCQGRGSGTLDYYDPGVDAEVWVFDGSLTGPLGRGDASTIVLMPHSHEGHALELADVTGDGANDLVVGSRFQHESGTRIFELPLPYGEVDGETFAVGLVEHVDFEDSVGMAVGDFDGDGIADLASGDQAPALMPFSSGDGGVVIHRGPLVGTFQPLADAYALFHVESLTNPYDFDRQDYSGEFSRAFIPDVDGDGTQDILMGGERLDNIAPPLWEPGGVQGGGLVLFTVGGATGNYEADAARAVLYGTCGARLSAHPQSIVGDVTGDCLPDVATGSLNFDPGDHQDRGAVLILSELRRVRGQAAATSVAGAIIVGEPGDDLGDVGYLGDLDQDGFDDLVVGARFGGDQGVVYLFLGPISGVKAASEADLVIYGTGDDEFFGSQVRGGRDIDGDGTVDLLVGAYGSNDGGINNVGAAYVFSGADLLAEIPP